MKSYFSIPVFLKCFFRNAIPMLQPIYAPIIPTIAITTIIQFGITLPNVQRGAIENANLAFFTLVYSHDFKIISAIIPAITAVNNAQGPCPIATYINAINND